MVGHIVDPQGAGGADRKNLRIPQRSPAIGVANTIHYKIVAATDALTQYDYWRGRKRAVFGTFGIGSKHYLASVAGREWVPPPKPSGTGASRPTVPLIRNWPQSSPAA